jgi:hypothetical protein
MTDRGIVGSVLPRVRPVEMALAPNWLLLMHTDGIKRRFDAQAQFEATPGGESLAQAILKEWGRATDDATVLVAQPG